MENCLRAEVQTLGELRMRDSAAIDGLGLFRRLLAVSH